jgi:hypothetical protein
MTTELATRPAGATALARMDPQTLIAQAIEKGAGIDQLERLVALAKDVRQEVAREKWHQAMAAFQADCPPIYKNRRATMRGGWGYTYADLEGVLSVVQPALARQGLSNSWRLGEITERAVTVYCRIAHEAGHVEESGAVTIPIVLAQDDKGASPPQRVGGALTYAKRQSLLASIGKTAEEDEDGNQGGEERGQGVGQPGQREESGRDPHERDVPGEHGGTGRPISEPQRKRYFAIARGSGWSEEQRHALLKTFGVESEDRITLPDYDRICEALKRGPAAVLRDERQTSLT